MDDISITTSRTDETAETSSLISNPSSDSSIAIPLTDEIPETDSISNPSSFHMPVDDSSITISPTDEIPETNSFVYNPSFASSGTTFASYKTERTVDSRKSRHNALPRNKYTDIPRVSYSPTDEIPETDYFIYNPSFALSGTTIASYKTERSINSRKSRYNALPRKKYADIPKVSYWSLAYGRLHYCHFSGCI